MAFVALGGASIHLAVSGRNAEASVARPADAPPAAGVRADIVDRNGELLASTLTSHSLFADPTRVWDSEATARALAEVLPDIDVEELSARLADDEDGRRRFVWIKRGLSPRQRQAVFDLGLPGLDFEEEPRRIYPRGRLAAHALGWTNIDGLGMAGAERAFEEELSRGDGRPVALSIDLRVQFALDAELRAASEEFDANAAVGLVTDVRTGEILALASLPDFDPNHPGDADVESRRNRAMGSVYELGSIFKTFTLAMALDTDTARTDTLLPTTGPLEVEGELIHDAAPAGRDLTTAEAFIRSSNVGMGALALAVGEQTQRDYLWRFGLMDRAPVDYPESTRPLEPETWDEAARATVGFGHGVAVSPVAFAAAFGAAVNGGEYVRPTLRPVGPRGAIADRVVSEETSAEIARLLRAAVLYGTGRRADAPGLGVGGKTGTAEKAVDGVYDTDRVVSSFAAVFPYDDPHYAILIVLDEPQGTEETRGHAGGGYTAAPIAGAVASRIAPFLGVAQASELEAHDASLDRYAREAAVQ
jgi:cell division protein FtsI (penicillin-binding protein 3)